MSEQGSKRTEEEIGTQDSDGVIHWPDLIPGQLILDDGKYGGPRSYHSRSTVEETGVPKPLRRESIWD